MPTGISGLYKNTKGAREAECGGTEWQPMNKQIEELSEELWRNTLIHSDELCEEVAEYLYNAGYRKLPENIGDFSDGYHTFNELYHHRAVLFSVICNMFHDKAWKSKLHDTGDMYDGMFIVGIETEQGQATYHYDIDPYWDMFKVKELEKAPKYDGHTPSDAIERIGAINTAGYHKQEWISVEERLPELEDGRNWGNHRPRSIRVLCVCKQRRGKVFVKEGYYELFSNKPCWRIPGSIDEITHWMPLPMPPKGDVGE